MTKKQKGFSLIMVLIMGTMALLIVSGLIGFANTNLTAGRRAIASEHAFQAAEAGVEYYRWLLGRGGSIATSTVYNYLDKNGAIIGTYELTPSALVGGVSLISRGRSGGAERAIRVNFMQGEGTSFRYGVQSGNGGFLMNNGSKIIGNVYSNQNIVGSGSALITGDAFASGTITGVAVNGEREEGAPPQPFAITQELIDGWKDDADANVFNGDKEVSGDNQTLGPIKIVGDLNIEGGTSLIITDTIWVTGNITIGNNASVSLSPSFNSLSGVIIADGTVDMGNTSSINGSGDEQSSILIVSLSNSPLAIDLGNNTRSVMLFAPNGTIDVNNNSEIKVVAANRVELKNNITLEYEQGIINTAFRSGPSGGWQVANWQEIR